MYQFVDRPLTSLNEGSRFLVWSMRHWVAAIGRQRCPGTVLAHPFASLNAMTAFQPFIRMMGLLNMRGLQQMKFCSATCPVVAEHEAVLLSALCLLADGRAAATQRTAALLVEETATGDLFEAMAALTGSMATAGLTPRWPASAPMN